MHEADTLNRIADVLLCDGGCGLRYGSEGWADVVLPDDVWAKIAPRESGGGVLCFNCTCRAIVAAGLDNVPCKITSGPLSLQPPVWSGDAPGLIGEKEYTLSVHLIEDMVFFFNEHGKWEWHLPVAAARIAIGCEPVHDMKVRVSVVAKPA